MSHPTPPAHHLSICPKKSISKDSASPAAPPGPPLPSTRLFVSRLLAGNSDHAGANALGNAELTQHFYGNSGTRGGKRMESWLKRIKRPKELGLR